MFYQIERTLDGIVQSIVRWPLVFWAIIIANVIGGIVGGIYWYGPMLQRSPTWALPFIPDCPLAAMLASIALLALYFGRRWSFFYALTAFACIKYGIWTVTFWLMVWSSAGFDPNPTQNAIEIMLFVSHIGLFLEGLILIPCIKPLSLTSRLAVIGWFVLSIYVDYGLDQHPPLYAPYVTPAMMGWTATLLTAALGIGLLALPDEHKVQSSTTPATQSSLGT